MARTACYNFTVAAHKILGIEKSEMFGGWNFRRCPTYKRTMVGRLLSGVALVCLVGSNPLLAQNQNQNQNQNHESALQSESALQEHYDAAQNFQAAGNLALAALHYKSFLAETLSALATHRAQARDFARANALFDEALEDDPNDAAVKVQYAQACQEAKDLRKAKSLAQEAADAEPRNAAAHRVLGQILLQMDDNKAATQHLEAAVALQPDFANGSALAAAYLKLKDEDHAAKIFAEMLASFGDNSEIHLQFGTAYANAGFPERAVPEFQKAIAENGKLPGAHYSLGAAYLLGIGPQAYGQAATEFQEELKISPRDYDSHLELGVIYLSQHNLPEAEAELKSAVALDPQNPDPLLSLGQLYDQTNRPTEAEAAYRKSIALTTDVSRNHFQVERAHYLLARTLLQSGRQDEAKKEMALSNQLLKQSVLEKQGQSYPIQPSEVPTLNSAKSTAPAPSLDPEAMKEAESFEKRMAPPIADSYNNLGAIAAGGNDFASALAYFQKAAQWNPSLEGLDYNWGRAAFSGHQYDQAITVLNRYLRSHPQDAGARSTLALSFFLLQHYQDALKSFEPIDPSQINAVPVLAYAYAVSLTKAGDYNQGIKILHALELAHPEDANIHKALGEAFAAHGDYAKAAEELRTAISENPADKEAERDLKSLEAAQKGNPATDTKPKPN
jgi:tetratricopeptide (TPR) repeat protein